MQLPVLGQKKQTKRHRLGNTFGPKPPNFWVDFTHFKKIYYRHGNALIL